MRLFDLTKYRPYLGRGSGFAGLETLEPRLLLSAIQSDDFSSTTLKPMWQFENPTGDCSLTLTGTNAKISVPSGREHDQWQNQDEAPRLMQQVDDVDFKAEVKFEAQPQGTSATEGILVQQDSKNFMRFDFFSTSSGKYRIFAASFDSGSPVVQFNKEFSGTVPAYMRVSRAAGKWTQWYSFDGLTWTTAASFSKTMAIKSIGPYAGNATNNPAFTASIDYFFNTASPIVPEDGPGDTTAPTLSSIVSTPGASQVQVTFQTNEPARGTIQYGLTTQYELGTVTETSLATAHSMLLQGLQSGKTYQFRIQATDASGNVGSSSNLAVTTTVSPPDTTAPVISSIVSTPVANQVQVTFQTNELARGTIQYGLTTQYELGTITETSLATAHSMLLQGLQPGTTYQFRLQATDASGNASAWTALSAKTASVATLRSDDFHASSLNAMWTFTDPLGNSSYSMDGQRVLLKVPAGTSHDLWAGENNSSRLVQNVEDIDFEVETKFESQPNAQYQMQGIVVEQDALNILRFDFHSSGAGQMNVFAADISGSSASTKLMKAITPAAVMYMRVRRQGTLWTQTYSYDGVTWLSGASFNRTIQVKDVGPFVGNSGNTSSSSPAYTAVVDYFFNTASPISPEDGGAAPPDTTPPQIQNVAVQRNATSLQISLATDELANVSVRYGLTTNYELGTVNEGGSAKTSHTVTLGSLTPITTYHYRIVATDVSGNLATSADMSAATASQDSRATIIDVWYGDTQRFGALGNPQKWVNVLGNVSDPDGIKSTSFTLNGGADQTLSLGPNTRRLQNSGDFNVEIDRATLREGDNTVVIKATDTLNNVTTHTVHVTYSSTHTWSLPYTADWSTVSDINQIAQVVDGKWKIENGTVRPVELGYDRLIAIGDVSWHDYEITLPVTLHGYDPLGFTWPAGVPALGVVMGWQGHYDWDGSQPTYGYEPLGAIASYQWTSNGTSTELVYDENPGTVAATSKVMAIDVTYMWRVRSDTQSDGRVLYSMKVWKQGTTEPTSWDMTTYDRPDSLKTGSILLVAHYTDVSFGKVTVTPI